MRNTILAKYNAALSVNNVLLHLQMQVKILTSNEEKKEINTIWKHYCIFIKDGARKAAIRTRAFF